MAVIMLCCYYSTRLQNDLQCNAQTNYGTADNSLRVETTQCALHYLSEGQRALKLLDRTYERRIRRGGHCGTGQ